MSIKRNTTYNLLGSILPLAVSLFTTPIYLSLIGEARYGVLAIVWLLLGYFGLFDLGLGRATAQRIAALRDSTDGERAKTFWTALILNMGLGVGGGVLIWPVASYFFAHIFKIDEALRPEVQAAVPWLILAVPMATLSGVLSGALQGRERFFELNVVSVFGTILFQILPLAAAMLLGADLGVLLPAALCTRLLTLLILFWRCWQHVFRDYTPTFAKAQAGQLLRFGGWVTLSSFVSPMMVILDRFIIGAMSSAKDVTIYTVPFQLSERSVLISSALNSALFPRFAAVGFEEEQRLANNGLRVLVTVMTPLVAAGILLMEPFLGWWISPAFAQESARVGQVILLGFWFNSLAGIPYAQLQARGRPDLVAKCHLMEVLPYFGLLYLGLSNVGLVGAAMAFSLRVFIDFALLAGLAGILKQSFHLLLVPVLLLEAAFWITTQASFGQPDWLALVSVYLLVTTLLGWRETTSFMKTFIFTRFKPCTH
ncbi:flippase [Crenothrix sp.]|uniref:flippase n=1 Tax=Crenothrix sp. TaxID=3100433 RepID=UPI00374DF2DE